MPDDLHQLCLLPRPRAIRRIGGWADPATLDAPRAIIDPAAVPHAQGYRLTITPDGVDLIAHDDAGLFYGKQTLAQLATHERVPCLEISDWPDFRRRGFMLDISRDKVPTMASLYELVDLLASLKYNQLQLYTEHTFAYPGHEIVWRDASPMTAEQVRALDAYCRERFIELVPNQNSFGHFHRWLKHAPYRHLAECPEGVSHPFSDEREPFSLCPTDPRVPAFLGELYDALLPNFSSRLFNVGCDETFDLGRCRSAEACRERGVGAVYREFLETIYDLVRSHGRTMMAWGDIINQHPEEAAMLPRDIVIMEWGYHPDHPFDDHCARHAELGFPFYVCPGTGTWQSFLGRTDESFSNQSSAASAGIRNGATGYLLTDWGDHGHLQPWAISLLPIAYGAGVSWCHLQNIGTFVPICETDTYDRYLFPHDPQGTAELLMQMGALRSHLPSWTRGRNSNTLFDLIRHPDMPLDTDRFGNLPDTIIPKFFEHLDHLSWFADHLAADTEIHREIDYALALAQHARRLWQARLDHGCVASELPATDRRSLADHLRPILDQHRTVWLARNREGGRTDSVRRLANLLEIYDSSQV